MNLRIPGFPVQRACRMGNVAPHGASAGLVLALVVKPIRRLMSGVR
jgi:hypothetical protein